MSILFLDAIDTHTFGGYENWILLTAKHLAQRGHAVTIAGRPGSAYLRRAKQLGNKVSILEIEISGDFNPVTINRLKSYLQDNNIDIITVNFNKDLRLGGLAARWSGGTRVIWRLGLDITKDSLVHRYLTPKLIDGVIVPSEALKHQVIRKRYLDDEMVSVIHNGTEIKHFQRPDHDAGSRLKSKYKFPAESIVAVTAARFVDQKGHKYLVEAARRIVDCCPDIRFLWLGDGPLEDVLRVRIQELALTECIRFAGMLDNSDLELSGADLMIHPAIEEPFSHAILEGMRAGLPVVATHVGGTSEAVIDGVTGVLVDPQQPDIMAEAVIGLLREPATLMKLGLAGQRRWRERFTVDRMVDKTEDYFLRIIGKERWHEPTKTA